MVSARLVVGLLLLGGALGALALGSTTHTSKGDDSAQRSVECAVAGPERAGSLRTDSFGHRQTVIAVGRDEVPNPIPEELDAYLKEQGAVLGNRLTGGRISMKAAWIRNRRAAGRVLVTGRRLHRPGGWFRAKVNRRYGGKSFARIVPSELLLSSVGCWRVRAKAGKARVTYVVNVRLPRDGEL